MNQGEAVHPGEGLGNTGPDLCRATDPLCQRGSLLNIGIQRQTAGQLHGEEEVALVGTDIEHPDDRGEPKGAKPLKLTPESGLVASLSRTCLQGNGHSVCTTGLPDLSLRTHTQTPDQSVRPQRHAWAQWAHQASLNIWRPRNVPIAMVVSCGFTPREEGKTLASEM